jgi:hypothetical protein
MEVQKEMSEIRQLKAEELDEVTGGFLGTLLAQLAQRLKAERLAREGCSCELG